jgi:hypothetical protein
MLLIVGVLVASCGDRKSEQVLEPGDSIPPPPYPKPTPALSLGEAKLLASALALNLDAEIDFATTSVDGFFAPPADTSRCVPTVSPTPVRNTDGDRAPDSMRLTFVHCARVRLDGTDSLSGTVDVLDPNPSVSGDSVRVVFTNFVRKRLMSRSTASFTATLNGERLQRYGGTFLVQSVRDFRTDYSFANGAAASELRTGSASFGSYPDSIIADQVLPAGSWLFQARASWVLGGRAFDVSIGPWGASANTETQPHLVVPPPPPPRVQYNPDCEAVSRMVGGSLPAFVANDVAGSLVSLVFSQCGRFTLAM